MTNHTFVRHPRPCFQVEPLAGARANFLDIIAECVAAILPAVQTDALVKGAVVAAPVGHALLVFIEQRVDEEMDRALMGTFHCLLKA